MVQSKILLSMQSQGSRKKERETWRIESHYKGVLITLLNSWGCFQRDDMSMTCISESLVKRIEKRFGCQLVSLLIKGFALLSAIKSPKPLGHTTYSSLANTILISFATVQKCLGWGYPWPPRNNIQKTHFCLNPSCFPGNNWSWQLPDPTKTLSSITRLFLIIFWLPLFSQSFPQWFCYPLSFDTASQDFKNYCVQTPSKLVSIARTLSGHPYLNIYISCLVAIS